MHAVHIYEHVSVYTCMNNLHYILYVSANSLVLAQEQYVVIHDALKDYITCGDTSVEAYQLRLAIRDMDKEEDGQSGFEQQFEVLA